MLDAVLLIIDMQAGNFTGPEPVRDGEGLLDAVARLVGRARDAGAPVVFVRNRGGPGDPDEPGTPGFDIHPRLAPSEGDVVVDKDTPDAFHRTALGDELEAMGTKRLIVAGLQTEYCVDTTCRRASLLGYGVVLVEDAHGTWDSPVLSARMIVAHHNAVLGGCFVKLVPERDVRF